MKLIIDIPEEKELIDKAIWYDVSDFDTEDLATILNAIKNGTPLDDVKAEIEQIYQDIDTCSHNEYENAVEQGKEIAYENMLEILNNIGKAESEGV